MPPSPLSPSVLDGLAVLVDNSLLLEEETPDGTPRLRMLEVVREFAWEQAATVGELAQARRAQAGWCLALAEEAEGGYYHASEPVWLARLERELDNLRAALEWAEEADAETGLRLASALWGFWLLRGRFAEGHRWLERFLAAATEAASPGIVARALEAAAVLSWARGDYQETLDRHAAGLRIWRELGDEAGVVRALNGLTLGARYAGDLDLMAAYAEQALAAARALGDAAWIGNALAHVGLVAVGRGDAVEGRRLLSEAVAVSRAAGYERGLAWTIQLLADLAAAQGQVRESAAFHQESLEIHRRIGDRWGLFEDLYALAALARDTGRPQVAARLLGAAAVLRERAGVVARADRATFDASLAATAAALPPGVFAAARDSGQTAPLKTILDEAEALAAALATGERAATDTPPEGAGQDVGGLSPRELEVLRLLAGGASTQAIADALFISHATARTHVTNILRKLDVSSRGAAVAYAYQRGLV